MSCALLISVVVRYASEQTGALLKKTKPISSEGGETIW